MTALVIGAWILPSRAQMERAPVGPVHTEAEIAADISAERELSVYINFPAQLADGQYCAAYAGASGGTPPENRVALPAAPALGLGGVWGPVIFSS